MADSLCRYKGLILQLQNPFFLQVILHKNYDSKYYCKSLSAPISLHNYVKKIKINKYHTHCIDIVIDDFCITVFTEKKQLKPECCDICWDGCTKQQNQ